MEFEAAFWENYCMTSLLGYIKAHSTEDADHQREALQAYATSAGHTLISVHEDVGPAKKLFARPGLRELFRSVLASEADPVGVLFSSFSDLGGCGAELAQHLVWFYNDVEIEFHLVEQGKVDLGTLIPGIKVAQEIARGVREEGKAAFLQVRARHRRDATIETLGEPSIVQDDPPTLKPAFAYVKIHGGREDEAIEDDDVLRCYAQAAGLKITRVFTDGYPRTVFSHELGLDAMLASAVAGEASAIVLTDFSVMALPIEQATTAIGMLLEKKIELHLARLGVKVDLAAVLTGLHAAGAMSRSASAQAAAVRGQVRRRRPVDYARSLSASELTYQARLRSGDVMRVVEGVEAGSCLSQEQRDDLVSRLGEIETLLRMAGRQLDTIPPPNPVN